MPTMSVKDRGLGRFVWTFHRERRQKRGGGVGGRSEAGPEVIGSFTSENPQGQIIPGCKKNTGGSPEETPVSDNPKEVRIN